ncbi:hypothetical protein [Chryseobacterium sp. RR2-3-20]|uniref:hypothetical protein n=1 Tax=Chryseobacterium sp. RR2-3-20 TaxID=2787626 RepID=UPI001AE05043|nr:hypothetical protein [Chryseobacterium sp. RR2-3-20]
MSNFNNLQRKLSEGLYAWMLYEFSCNKAYVFNEKYISYPISNILSNNLNKDQNVLTEQNHPLKNDSKGRPIQVDFVIADKYKKPINWEIAIETKWIGSTEIKFVDVLWDLVRLQNLFTIYPNIKCYFIIAGNKNKIDKFWNDCNKGATKRIVWETSKGTYFKLSNLKITAKKNINELISAYPKFNLYSKISCGISYKYPINDKYNMTFGTFLIEVKNPNITHKILSL